VNTFHTFKEEGIEGEGIDFAANAGKNIMVSMLLQCADIGPQYQRCRSYSSSFEDKLSHIGFPDYFST